MTGPLATRICAAIVALASATAVAGCSSSSGTAQKAAAPRTQSKTASTTTTTPQGTFDFSGYSSETFNATIGGWTYRFTPAFRGLSMSVSKDVSSSPPGKAKYRITMSAPASFPGTWVNTDEGRSAPRLGTSAAVLFPLTTPYDGWGGVSDPQLGQFGPMCNNTPDFPTSLIPGAAGSFDCDSMFFIASDQNVESVGFGTSPGSYTLANSFGEDLPETSVDALIAALSGVKPVIQIIAGGGSLGSLGTEDSISWYFPDGRRVQAIGQKGVNALG